MPQFFGLHHRHSRLFLLFCFIPLVFHAIQYIFQDNLISSIVLVITATAFAFNFFVLSENKIPKRNKTFLVLCMVACLWVKAYELGLEGVVYLYPSVVGVFFLFPIFQSILIASMISFGVLTVGVFNDKGDLSIELLASISLTIIFSAFNAYYAKYQSKILDQQAEIDTLTNIANRFALNIWLEKCQQDALVNSVSLIHIDIDDFRLINDKCGFSTGDCIIKQLAKKLNDLILEFHAVTSASPFVVRLSGDEFVIALTNLPKGYDFTDFVLAVNSTVEKIYIPAHRSMVLTACLGIATVVKAGDRFINAIDNASAALGSAKKKGKNNFRVFDEHIALHLSEQKFIVNEIHKALEEDEFHLVFMPIYQRNGREIAGAEILLRCSSRILNNYGPAKFIPIAESLGLIKQIDYWVIEKAFQIISQHKIFSAPGIIFHSINISINQLHNTAFIEFIEKMIERYKIEPSLIKFEVTETCLVDVDFQAVETLIALKRLGFKLSLDDFGTGYTSFNQLKKYPLDSLKIDRSFVSGDEFHPVPLAGMSEVILSIAKLHHLDVIAEGVETKEQYLELKAGGCQFFQGYWFSKPVELATYIDLIIDNVCENNLFS